MDSPILVTIFVFVGIFVMFFIISLLSDLLIVAIALGCAVSAYLLPEIYQAPYFQSMLNDITVLRRIGIVFPPQLDPPTHYLLGIMLIFAGTLACIPMLPFSATYRQMLGANKLSGRDEHRVRHLVREELDYLRQRALAQTQKKPLKTPQPKANHGNGEAEPTPGNGAPVNRPDFSKVAETFDNGAARLKALLGKALEKVKPTPSENEDGYDHEPMPIIRASAPPLTRPTPPSAHSDPVVKP